MSNCPPAGRKGCLPRASVTEILKNASSPNWEDKVEKIELIFKDSRTGRLNCTLVWKDADKTTHPVKGLHVKCPLMVCHLPLTENPS
jgi:hypothetical protein